MNNSLNTSNNTFQNKGKGLNTQLLTIFHYLQENIVRYARYQYDSILLYSYLILHTAYKTKFPSTVNRTSGFSVIDTLY